MPVEAKICGLTRPEDAALAAANGAWRLGVIFAGGPRLVDVPRARAIVAAAPRVPVMGVFGTQPVETILETVDAAGLGGAQLHGAYSTRDAAWLRQRGVAVWRVIDLAPVGWSRETVIEAMAEADALLVEPRVAGGSGGRGVPLALDIARAARDAVRGTCFVLAGGLTPGTLREAIRVVEPDVVDVSSGVEMSPGIKDPERLVRFLEIVRDARTAA